MGRKDSDFPGKYCLIFKALDRVITILGFILSRFKPTPDMVFCKWKHFDVRNKDGIKWQIWHYNLDFNPVAIASTGSTMRKAFVLFSL